MWRQLSSGTILTRDDKQLYPRYDCLSLSNDIGRAMNSWIYLFTAGFFEIGFTTCMKLSDGFSVILYTAGFLICAALSFYCLNKSLTTIPLGTAYAVWTGVGAFGTAIIGMIFFKDPVSVMRSVFLFLLIGSILGLKLVSAE